MIAVPDLQRNGRNSNILHDAQNVASAVQSFESNNQGSLPGVTTADISKTGPTVTVTNATLTNPATTTATVQGSDVVTNATSVPAQVDSTNAGPGNILVVVGADCSTASGQASGSKLNPNPDTRAVAIFYPIEISGGSNVGCVQE